MVTQLDKTQDNEDQQIWVTRMLELSGIFFKFKTWISLLKMFSILWHNSVENIKHKI